MSVPKELAAALQEVFARETSLFEAYAAALRSAETRLARETLLACETASARARGRLMAEIERQEIPYSEGKADPESLELAALVQASEDARVRLDRIAELAEDRGDDRLARLARELAQDHESRRKSLQALVREKGGKGKDRN